MEAEIKPKRKRRTKAEMEAARAAEVKKPTKRKRRTKAQIAADNAKDIPPEPQWFEQGYTGPKPFKPPKQKKTRTYPIPKPRPKFDTELLDDIIVFNGGAKYARTIETKNGRNIMTWSDMSKDWMVLYDAKYNDNEYHWKRINQLKERTDAKDQTRTTVRRKKSRKSL